MVQRRKQLLEHLRQRNAAVVDESLFHELKLLFGDRSENWIRRSLRTAGVRLTPLVEGVRQESLDALERTLDALADEFEAGTAERKRQVRRIVRAAKTRAQWSARKKPEKAETVEWLRIWLQNPPVFRLWAALRRRQLQAQSAGALADAE